MVVIFVQTPNAKQFFRASHFDLLRFDLICSVMNIELLQFYYSPDFIGLWLKARTPVQQFVKMTVWQCKMKLLYKVTTEGKYWAAFVVNPNDSSDREMVSSTFDIEMRCGRLRGCCAKSVNTVKEKTLRLMRPEEWYASCRT